MSERLKYSKNGVYRCGNFAQHLAGNTFPEIQLGTIGGINGWYIKMKVIENGTIVYPVIHCHNKPQLYIHYYFNILGNGQSFFNLVDNVKLYETYGPRGHDMKILDILNQKNGYLDNGTLSIEYGFHINGIQGVDGNWKFNFNDILFNFHNTLTIEYGISENGSPKVLYGHKQLLRFHSPLFQNQVSEFFPRTLEKWQYEECLQMAHGVRIQLDKDWWSILWIAHSRKMRNVIQYSDQQLVKKYCNPEDESFEIWVIENCIELGMRHLLAHLVSQLKSSKDLKIIIQKLNIQKMSGEAMKTFMAKIFKLST